MLVVGDLRFGTPQSIRGTFLAKMLQPPGFGLGMAESIGNMQVYRVSGSFDSIS